MIHESSYVDENVIAKDEFGKYRLDEKGRKVDVAVLHRL